MNARPWALYAGGKGKSMKRTVQTIKLDYPWFVWETPQRLKGQSFATQKEAEAYEAKTGGFLEYIEYVYPAY